MLLLYYSSFALILTTSRRARRRRATEESIKKIICRQIGNVNHLLSVRHLAAERSLTVAAAAGAIHTRASSVPVVSLALLAPFP